MKKYLTALALSCLLFGGSVFAQGWAGLNYKNLWERTAHPERFIEDQGPDTFTVIQIGLPIYLHYVKEVENGETYYSTFSIENDTSVALFLYIEERQSDGYVSPILLQPGENKKFLRNLRLTQKQAKFWITRICVYPANRQGEQVFFTKECQDFSRYW